MTDPSSEALYTTGMALPQGAMIEQLTGRRLLFSASGKEQIGAGITHAGQSYGPMPLQPAYEALLCDQPAAPYTSLGGLLEKLSTTIHLHTGLDSQDSLLVGLYVLATWVAEFLPAPPCLNIYGPAGTETSLFDLLSYLCRRPLTLLDPSLRQLSNLPESLCPTIFLRHPTEKSLGRLLTTSRDPNVLYGDRLLHLSSPFVVFTTRPLSLPSLRVAMPVLGVPYRRLARDQAKELHTIRGQLLMYRLLHHEQVAQSDFDVPRFAHESRVIARILGACMEGDATSQPAIVSALEDRDENEKVQRSQTPKAAVLEGLLVLVHEKHATARVKEATALANAILHARMDPCTLTPKAVGAMIGDDDLRLPTDRKNSGYQLELDFATCTSIHHHAQAHGVLTLLEPHPDCVFCSALAENDNPLLLVAPTASCAPSSPCTPSSPCAPCSPSTSCSPSSDMHSPQTTPPAIPTSEVAHS